MEKVSCSMYILSQEIKEKAKKLQITTYALRDAIAATLTTHPRSVEMHFPITTADGFKIGFTIFSSKLVADDIYRELRKGATPPSATEPATLPKTIKNIWNLESTDLPRIPINEIKVEGIDPADYEDFEWTQNFSSKRNKYPDDLSEGAGIEMVGMGGKGGKNIKPMINEGNAIAMMGAFKANVKDPQKQPLNSGPAQPVTDYDAQMAALNAQIAMNQYLMMKQLEVIQQKKNKENGNNNDNNNLSEMQQLMMDQMQVMNGMINMNKPYDPNQFNQWNDEWKQQRGGGGNNNQNNNNQNDDNNYEPPNIPKSDDDQNNDNDEQK